MLKIGGADIVNRKNSEGDTPLIVAVKADSLGSLKVILEAGAMVNETNKKGFSPLHVAILNDQVEYVGVLLGREGILVNVQQNAFGFSPLHLAAYHQSSGCLDLLLAVPVIEINPMSGINLATPLSCAAKFGSLECMSALLRMPGIQFNTRDITGTSPLQYAISSGASGGAKALLDRPDIELHGENNDKDSLLHSAAKVDDVEILRMLLKKVGAQQLNEKNSHGNTVFNCAAESREGKACFDFLLGIGNVDVDNANKDGMTPLFSLSINSHLKSLRKLLASKKVDLNRKNNLGLTVLYYVMHSGLLACANIILNEVGINVNVNVKDADGNALLHSMASSGDIECFNALLEMSTLQFGVRNKMGQTPLHLAVQRNSSERLKALLKKNKINLNAKDNDGNTVLHYAINMGSIECLKILLYTWGIEINVSNNKGDTPLNLVAKNANLIVLNMLLEQGGADVNAANNDGFAPLYYALRNSGEAIEGHNDEGFMPQLSVPMEECNSCLNALIAGKAMVMSWS